MAHADLPDAGRVSHFEIDAWLPAPNEKAALVGDPVPAGDANRYLTQNHAAGGFDGFANPAASVGLVAVNGVATTAMRSDGAPALDQGIIPTWTGLHTFGAGLAVSAGQGIAMADETCWFGIGAALERININAAGYLSVMGANFGVGAAIPISLFDVSASNVNTVASVVCYDDGASEGRVYLRKSDTDTIGTLAQTDDGDWLGLAGFQGVTSTPGWGYGVLIYAVQRGVAGVTYIETDLIFQTYSAVGGNANQLVLAGGTGFVGFGTPTPDAKLQIVGDLKVGDDDTNYVLIGATGDVIFVGSATVWNDIYFPMSSGRIGGANQPTWAAFQGNTMEYSFAINDYIHLPTQEIAHSYKEGSDIKLHVHIVLDGSDVGDTDVNYEIEYTIGDEGEVMSAAAVVTSGDYTITGGTADRTHIFIQVGTIVGTNLLMQAALKMRFRRIALVGAGNAPSNDPFVLMVGVHIEEDTVGSRTETTK